jgi:glycosyltransferase involved in cell wall biosynthesis
LESHPAVSIILPTYNRLLFLQTAIQSILDQTFPDWELLLADDGSAGPTRDYLQSLINPPRIRTLWLQHSGNPPAVRNRALSEARGTYVAFLDSDDEWMPEKLAVQIAAIRANGARPWSYTGFTLIDEHGDALTGTRAKRCPAIDGEFLDPLIRGEPLIMQSSVVVRRDLIEAVGGYDEELPICGDYALWIRLAQRSQISFIDVPLVRVRRHQYHYSSDIEGLEDLRRLLEKLLQSRAAPHLDAVLRDRRARAAVGIARGHAQCHRWVAMLRTLYASAPQSWRHRAWWRGAVSATARAFVPDRLLKLVRSRQSIKTS